MTEVEFTKRIDRKDTEFEVAVKACIILDGPDSYIEFDSIKDESNIEREDLTVSEMSQLEECAGNMAEDMSWTD
jgi:hypothetical protein